MCKVFLNMIWRFCGNHSFEIFMTPCPYPGMEAAVNNLVAGKTKLGWSLRARVWAFYAICALQRWDSDRAEAHAVRSLCPAREQRRLSLSLFPISPSPIITRGTRHLTLEQLSQKTSLSELGKLVVQ